MLEDIKRDLKIFWEKASLWSDINEITNARIDLKEIKKKLEKFEKVQKTLTPEQLKSLKLPIVGTRGERLEHIIENLKEQVRLAEAHIEGATERAAHARMQLRKMGAL